MKPTKKEDEEEEEGEESRPREREREEILESKDIPVLQSTPVELRFGNERFIVIMIHGGDQIQSALLLLARRCSLF
jgi:hypothetical protein